MTIPSIHFDFYLSNTSTYIPEKTPSVIDYDKSGIFKNSIDFPAVLPALALETTPFLSSET